VEVADIFRAHGAVYRQQRVLTPDQARVMRAIEACRTPALGGHLDVCERCGHEQPSYNSCRDRHCPKCQSLAQARWIDGRMERLLPVHYFHVVLTLPPSLRPVARRNQRAVYKLLFEAASEALLTLGGDEKRLGGELGITAVLHTWTRELEYHPHLHCIVTGGGLSPDGLTWRPARRKYLFPIRVLSLLFRRLFLEGLARAHDKGDVRLDEGDLTTLIKTLSAIDWVVYVKPPFGGPEQVFRYLGRYTHRVGISNQRLLSMDEHGVRFATKNGQTITLPPQEFIRRFLLHVLPPGFVKIRHYGLWAAGHVHTRLCAARGLLATNEPPAQPPSVAEVQEQLDDDNTWQQRLLRLAGIDVTRCPRCGQGTMVSRPLGEPSAVRPVATADTS